MQLVLDTSLEDAQGKSYLSSTRVVGLGPGETDDSGTCGLDATCARDWPKVKVFNLNVKVKIKP